MNVYDMSISSSAGGFETVWNSKQMKELGLKYITDSNNAFILPRHFCYYLIQSRSISFYFQFNPNNKSQALWKSPHNKFRQVISAVEKRVIHHLPIFPMSVCFQFCSITPQQCANFSECAIYLQLLRVNPAHTANFRQFVITTIEACVCVFVCMCDWDIHPFILSLSKAARGVLKTLPGE